MRPSGIRGSPEGQGVPATRPPFGDFDLLLGAARLHLRIVDIPIRDRGRSYGTTNISRWTHGAALLAMIDRAAR
jgi:hypothetical protein